MSLALLTDRDNLRFEGDEQKNLTSGMAARDGGDRPDRSRAVSAPTIPQLKEGPLSGLAKLPGNDRYWRKAIGGLMAGMGRKLPLAGCLDERPPMSLLSSGKPRLSDLAGPKFPSH